MALSLLLGSTLVFGGVSAPQTSPSALIAFVGRKGVQTDLWVVRADGSELRQITNDPAPETFPTWSPDGTRVAYISSVEDPQTRVLSFYVYVAKLDGSAPVRVTADPIEHTSSVVWSPDGTRLAFERGQGTGQGLNLYAVNADGTNATRLTTAPTNDLWPHWSSTNRIAFLGSRNPGGFGIYTVNPDGGAVQPLRLINGLVYGPVRWSPDATRVLYNQPNRGGITICLANGTQPDAVGECAPDMPEWSKDGRKVVFVDSGHNASRVMVSVDKRVATPEPGTDNARSPSLSPDGAWVAFATDDGTDPVNFLPAYALKVTRLGSGTSTKVPIDVRPVPAIDGSRRFFIQWAPIDGAQGTGSGSQGSTGGPGGQGQKIDPGVRPPLPNPLPTPAPAPQGSGFPGTPVGPDRTSNPLGAAKTTGTGFTLTAPSSVTVGDAFFGPEPLALKTTRPAALAKTAVVFSVVSAPAGLKAVVAGKADGTATLSLSGLSALAVGEYPVVVKAVCGTSSAQATITVVRHPARILLVDDDYEGNNNGLAADPSQFLKGTLSTSDAFYRAALDRGNGQRSLIYDTVGVDRYGNGPDAAAMAPYDFVLWYLGVSYGGNPDNTAVLSGVDETNVRAYLAEGGGRTFMLVGPGYLNNVARGLPTSRSNEAHFDETDSLFLKKAVGIKGARGMFSRFTEADLIVNGQTFMMGKSPVAAMISPMNPDTATVLATTELDPDKKGLRQVPVATWNRVGDANMVMVAFTLENVTVNRDRLMGWLLGIRIAGM